MVSGSGAVYVRMVPCMAVASSYGSSVGSAVASVSWSVPGNKSVVRASASESGSGNASSAMAVTVTASVSVVVVGSAVCCASGVFASVSVWAVYGS